MKILSLVLLLSSILISNSQAQVEGNAGRSAGNGVVTDASNAAIYGYNSYNAAYQNSSQRSMTQFLNDTTMLVTITGLSNVKADAYVAIFAVTQSGNSVDSATILMNDRIKRFSDGLKKLGLKSGDMLIDQISQVPVYEYAVEKKLFSSTYNEVPTGFEIKKNIHISYTNPDLLDDIMMAAAKSEIYDIVKVDYNVNEIAAKYAQLRKECLKQIKEKIEDFASMGLRFQPINQTFTESSQSYYPIQLYANYTAVNTSAVQIVNTSLDKNAKVNVAAKPVTYYYNKIPYNQFDVVLNPHMVEPSVQFTYSVSIKYTLKGPERPLGVTGPIAEVKKEKKKRSPVKFEMPNTFNFKFEVPQGEEE
jgi:uncharacterized protein YggE